jgi:uncharacterized membrane protein YbhN (UPF0104 family)
LLQVSKLYSLKKVVASQQAFVLLKAAVLITVIFYVVYTLFQAHIQLEGLLQVLLSSRLLWLPVVAVAMAPVNWSFEALKWKYLLRGIEKVSFRESFAGVLCGLSFGFVTPQSIGDYAGRVLRLRSAKKYRSLGALMVSNLAQFIITLLAGSVSIAYLILKVSEEALKPALYLLLLLNVIALLLIYNFPRVVFFLKDVNRLKKIYRLLATCGVYQRAEILFTLLLALLRYLTFSLQFVLMLLFTGVALPLHILFLGVAFVFIAKSVLPVLNTIGDLGPREASALFFFGFFTVQPEKVVVASLAVWIMNILLPSLAGLIVVLKTRLAS